jgi:hypothetical protein
LINLRGRRRNVIDEDWPYAIEKVRRERIRIGCGNDARNSSQDRLDRSHSLVA